VILLVGVPSAFFNRTALALVGSWGVQEAMALLIGQPAEWLTGFALDYSVLLIIFTCPGARTWHDWAVAAIFPVMWAVHALVPDPYYRWWTLWWLALIQFGPAAAGAVWKRRHAPPPPHGLTIGNLFASLAWVA
jgi:hypothetical protein